MAQTEFEDDFKFPHETEETKGKPEDTFDIDIDAEDDVDIQIEDDTPEKDRDARPLGYEVEDPSDEELDEYSKSVQLKIKKLTHARHDERRAKEEAVREKTELERMARSILEENQRLKEYVKNGEVTYAETLQAKAEAEMQMARRKYKEAQESYDSDAMLEAQENLTDAKMKLESAKNFKPTPLQNDNSAVQIQSSSQEAPRLDDKTLRWQAKNQWFGAAGNEELTSFSLGLHQKLVNSGVDPRSDEYFERIDARMRSTFPESFGGREARSTRPSSVVASATRSSGPKKVQLTLTQMALAKKFGLTPQQYAVQVAKLENQNG